MRKVVAITASGDKLFAACEDGTLWARSLREEATGSWVWLEGPPDGPVGQRELTNEELAERLRKRGRKMLLGRGLKE